MNFDKPISAQWRIVSVGDVAQINYGKALRSEERKGEGDVPVYGSGGIVGEHNVALHSGPSIIVGRKGTVGAVYYISRPFWCIDTAFYLSDFSSFIDVEYLAHILRYTDLSRFSIVVGVPGINRNDIKTQKFPLPPLAEQHRIVSILRQADRLRQLRREAEEKAQQLLPALFDEMFGDPSINSKGWPMVPVENLLRSSPHYGTFDAAKEQGEYLTLRVGNIVEDNIDFSDKKFVNLSAADYKRFRVHDGDLLLIRAIGSASLLGKCAVYRGSDNKIVFDSHLMRLQFNLEIIVPEYFQGCLASKGGRIILSQYMRASAVQYNINTKEIRSIAIPVPPIQLQKDFLYKRTSFNKRYKALISNQQLDTLFQSLLAQAFSGELTAAWREEHEGLESIQVFPELVRPVEEKGLPIVEETVAETIEKMIGRVGVVAELSDKQQQILNLVLNTKGYCTVEALKATSNLPVHAIRQGLQLLTRIGLIQAVRLPDRPIRTIVYVPVYRVIDDGDVARTPDIGLLQQALQREMAL